MPTIRLTPPELRLTITPDTLEFADTSALLDQDLPWIGQERAEQAVLFGLAMEQADYNLFVLGEAGSGRSSLLKEAMAAMATRRPTPPDLCYLHNFDAPERPRALRLPAGRGRMLRQAMAGMAKTLLTAIPQQLNGPEVKVESERLVQAYKQKESQAFSELDAFAEARDFSMRRESDNNILFTLRGPNGQALTEDDMLLLPKERRNGIAQKEQEVLAEINRYFAATRPLEQEMRESLAALHRQAIEPLLARECGAIQLEIADEGREASTLAAYLEQVKNDLLDHLELFNPAEDEDDLAGEALAQVLSRYRINLIVDNDGLCGAPVIVEDNPLYRSLFGSIEYQTENDVLVTDFSRIRAGSLLRAHGGFLMLHLRDVAADGLVWETLRRFLRSGRLQIEEPGTAYAPIAAVSLTPEPVNVDVKIVLIGSRDFYYELQETDPELARHFRVKVDFADQFVATDATRRATAVLVARTCDTLGLPHFSAAAVARLLEQGHREAEDRTRQSALFGQATALIAESAALCKSRHNGPVAAADVEAALAARYLRHDYPEQLMREAVADGDVLISLDGERIGQVNGLSVVDLGDHRFGHPVRVSARTYAGGDGLINIEREVALSGPIHDKGVLILQHYLAALFARNAPLALSASIVLEQEYNGIEGDSASCAELFALLSSLATTPIRQGIAVTGALNQHGEVLPVGGINEKIEGYFRLCLAAGLDGSQGVLMPHRNRRHLMLDSAVIEAVRQGLFHIHTMERAVEGMELLTGLPAGSANQNGVYPPGSLLHRVQKALRAFRRACDAAEHRPESGRTRPWDRAGDCLDQPV
ncbi:AAA family ATPase [Desulfobulbus sp.]|uniref:Lon protease family protein n=1 Tax=Desulfobulbus sp. TaxID=895 RepID=UPI00286F11CE|nr:AAA family ATPase [Desulfobulbus sp.]